MLTWFGHAFQSLLNRPRQRRRRRGYSGRALRRPLRVELLESRITPSSLPDLAGYDLRPLGYPQYYFHELETSPPWGSTIHVECAIANLGATPSAPETYDLAFYLSADSTIDTGDMLLADYTGNNVPAGNSFSIFSSVPLNLPATNPFGGSGPYYVGMIVNASGAVAESNYANNSNQGTGIDETTLAVNPGVSVAPTSLPNWTAGLAGYSQTLVASGGTGPYTFSSTGTLPAGLALSSTGVLSGTPSTAGSYNFTVTATDSTSSKGSQSYTVTINPALAITTPSLSSWLLNQPGYNQTISATGGTGSLTFTKTAGSVPTGLTLSTGGVLTGTPTAAGSYTFTVQAADTVGATASATYTVSITTSIHLVVTAPSSTTAGGNFNFTVQAEDSANNPYSGFSGLVTFTTTDPAGTVPAPAMVNGGFGFFLASLQTAAGGPWTISATSGAMSALSGPITVVPAKATQLAFTQQPASTPTGFVLPTVAVAVEDAYGNVVSSDNTDAVTLSVASGPASFTANSTATVVAQNGVATFNNLALVVPGTYTLGALVAQAFSGRNSTAFGVTPLQVVAGSFAGTPSGFSLQFNGPFLATGATPVLYGHGFGASAPVPSVTLTQIRDGSGHVVNNVISGSLVLNPATNSIAFVTTDTNLAGSGSPVLPDGVYVADIHSSAATDGFQALFSGGGFLDGKGTGTPGSGDFTASFSVNVQATNEDVVWVPPTADGPGQALSAPGKNQVGGGYPIYLDDTTGTVTDVLATLNYNPTLLTISGVTGSGFSLLSTSTPGQAMVEYNGPALPAGLQTPIGFITGTVPSGTAAIPMPYKTQDLLHLSSVSVNRGAVQVATSDGIHLVAFAGDGDGNGSYSSSDAVLITRALLNTDSGFTAYPLVDPVIVADTDGSGFIPADGALQANEAGVGLPTASLTIPPVPPGVQFLPAPAVPGLIFFGPAYDAIVSTNVTVSGRLNGGSLLQEQMDGGGPLPVTVNALGYFSFTTALAVDGSADGTHAITLQTVDSAGHVLATYQDLFTLSTTVIPDAGLAAAVRTTLGLPTGAPITKSELLGLTTLSADSTAVGNLAGLQYATNLQALTLAPSDWSFSGYITNLSPLSGLTHLQSLTLTDAGITNSALAALGSLSGLKTLDLRYNPISDISAVASLPSLTSLHVFADPVTNLAPLAGKLVLTDIPVIGADTATTISGLAQALQESPIEIFQYLVNNFTYQPYNGAKKGALATLQMRAGDDWDLDSLLAALLGQTGVPTQYVSGTINVPIATLENWLGVTDPGTVGSVLANANLNPVAILDGGGNTTGYNFTHTWLQAQVIVPGGGLQWVSLDPSWKFRNFNAGIPNMLSLVPFSETTFFAQTQAELPSVYYVNQVSAYLAANQPGVSLSDVAHTGPISTVMLPSLPGALPYTVVGTPTTSATIPSTMTFRVNVTLQQGGSTLFQDTLSLPDMSLQRVTVGYAPAAGGLLTPQLLVGGAVVAQGPAISNGSGVTLVLNHYDEGSSAVSESFSYSRQAGQYLAIGLDAGQYSGAYMAAQHNDINSAAVAARDGATVSADSQVGALLALAIATYFNNCDTDNLTLDGLTDAVPVFNHVASGIATSGSTVKYFWALANPAVPGGINVDVANSFHQEFTANGNTANDPMRQQLLGDNSSAQESNTWEVVANTTGISTIKSIQLANQRSIPVFTITSSNASTYIPQLTIDPSTVAAIQAEVSAGATVIVPRDPTPLNLWQGVGYIVRQSFGGGAFSEAYIIAGGLASSSVTSMQGGSGTGDPNNPNFQPGNPNGNQTSTGDPVNIANGDVSQEETDITLPGIGLSLTFMRRYDSQNTADVGLGTGWVYSYSDHLTFPGGGAVVWNDSEGHPYTFLPNGSGGFVTPATIYGTLTSSASGYAFTDKNGLVHQFNNSGQLTQIVDRNGNALVMAYDTSGHLRSVTEAGATERQLTFTYSGTHITAVSDGTGRTWSYLYSGSQLIEVDAPTVAAERYAYYTDVALFGLLRQVTLPNGGTTMFTYYGDGRAYQVIDADGFANTYTYNLYLNITAYTDARGNTTFYAFDPMGEVAAIQQPNGAVVTQVWTNGLKTSDTDVYGHTETFQYDAQGNILQFTDRGGNVTSYTYDPVYNQILTVTAPGSRMTQYFHDAHGNTTKIIDAMGDVTTMTYDSHGLMLTQTSPRGNASSTPSAYTTTYVYNDAGQILTESTALPSVESYAYDNRGHLISATDADNHTTTYVYDLLDQLIQTTNAAGGQTSYVYNGIGDVVATTDALGRTTRYTYDPLERKIKTTSADGTVVSRSYDPAGNLIAIVDELGRVTQTIYDVDNLPIEVIYADGTTSETAYDGGGRIIATTDANGNVSRFTYDALGRLLTSTDAQNQTTTRTYDAVGNLLSVTDPLSRTTSYQYDKLNRKVAVTDALKNTTTTTYDADSNVVSVTDALHETTSYTFDVRDRLVATTNALSQTTNLSLDAAGNVLVMTDPAGNKTTYVYSPLNRVLSQTNALNATETFTYDGDGNVVSSTDGDGRTRRFTYDARNRETSEQWLDSMGKPIYTFQFTYDAAGQLTRVSDADSTYSYTYDPRGRQTSVSNQGTPGSPVVALAYAYDNSGNKLSISDTINGVADGTVAMTYNMLNEMTQITQSGTGVASERVDLGYDHDGELTNIARYADLAGTQLVATTSETYSADGLVIAQTDSRGATTLASYTWTYDAGNRVSQETSPDGTVNYGYDNTNQLVSATSASLPNESYSYDANGNRTNSGYMTGPANQLLSDGTYNYAYDGAGNLIKSTQIATGAVTQYTWDYRNRLTGVTTLDSSSKVIQQVQYTYDVFDRRIAKSVVMGGAAPVVTRFVYNGDKIALQFNGSGAVTDRYLYGPAIDQIFADQNATNGVLWALTDNLASVREVITSSGTIVDHLVYNSFGQISSESNPAVNFLFAYAGQVLDRETGLQDDGARYYNPATGRFLSQDPTGFSAGDANLYRYVGNDSPNMTDPTGRSGWNRFFGGLRLVGGLLQAAGGTAFAVITSETGVGAVAGGVVAVKGLDDAWAGAQQLWTGQTTQTYTYQGVQYVTGSSAAASIVDVGIDLAAAPISSAGLSSLSSLSTTATVAEEANAAENAANTTSTIAENAANGKAFEQEGLNYLEQVQNNVADQVSVRPYTDSGELADFRVRLDAVGTDESGNLALTDFKSSETAGFTPNQTAGYPLLEQNGGVVVGNNGLPWYPPGTVIPPTPVTIIRPGGF